MLEAVGEHLELQRSNGGEERLSVAGIRVSEDLDDALKRVARTGERIILKRRGRDVAALIPIDELRVLERLEDEADLAAARKAKKEKGGVSIEEIKKRIGMS